MKKIGDKARYTEGVSDYFPFGEILEVVKVDKEDIMCTYKLTNGEDDWWICNEDLEWLDDEEWKPQKGEMVQVKDDEDNDWRTYEFITTYKGMHCVVVGCTTVLSYSCIRQLSELNITEVKHPNLK